MQLSHRRLQDEHILVLGCDILKSISDRVSSVALVEIVDCVVTVLTLLDGHAYFECIYTGYTNLQYRDFHDFA